MKVGSFFFNPLSATWRIYPSSKWSSQWPYDGYIRHGWMTSCGRGRDSATLECFGRGCRGTIFVRSSKLSLFFPELWPFRRVFLFPALLKDLAPNVQALGLLVRMMFWGSFWKLRSVTAHFFANSDYDHKYFMKISFLFSKAEPVLLAWQLWRSQVWAKHFGDGTSKTRMKTRLPGVGEIERRRTIDRRRDWYASRVRWSMVQKRKKKHMEVSVWLCGGSTLHHLQTSEFWGACFRDPTSLHVATVRTSLFSWTWMYSCRMVKLQRGDSEEKQSSVTFPVLITEA